MLEILMYIFEKFMQPQLEDRDAQGLSEELELVGFEKRDIRKTLVWLSDLADYQSDDQTQQYFTDSMLPPGIRVFTQDESRKLGRPSMGFIHFLQQSGVLTPRLREILIERAMAVDIPKLTLFQMKWVALFTLFYQTNPDSESDLSWLEALVFAEANPQHLN